MASTRRRVKSPKKAAKKVSTRASPAKKPAKATHSIENDRQHIDNKQKLHTEIKPQHNHEAQHAHHTGMKHDPSIAKTVALIVLILLLDVFSFSMLIKQAQLQQLNAQHTQTSFAGNNKGPGPITGANAFLSKDIIGVNQNNQSLTDAMLENGLMYYRIVASPSIYQINQYTGYHDSYPGVQFLAIIDNISFPSGTTNSWGLDDWNSAVTSMLTDYPFVTTWEIWNEPHVLMYSAGYEDATPGNYATMIEAAATIIHKKAPGDTVVCFGGAGPTVATQVTFYTDVWDDLGSDPTQYCNAISIHTYVSFNGIPLQSTWQPDIDYFEQLTGLPIWDTEVGKPSSVPAEYANGYTYTPALQDEFLNNAFQILTADANVVRIYWFNEYGLNGPPNDSDFGLFQYGTGTPKPAYDSWLSYYECSSAGTGKGCSGTTPAPQLAIQQTSTTYGTSDVVTATAGSSSDTVEILSNEQVLASGTGSATYNLEQLGAGSYLLYADDTSAELTSLTTQVTIGKATPTLSLPGFPQSYAYTGSGSMLVAEIQSINNQLTANDYINNNRIASFTTENSYTTNAAVGPYIFQANTLGNGNYIATGTPTQSFTIAQANPQLTLNTPSNYVYDGDGGMITYGITSVKTQLTATLYVNNVDVASTNQKSASYTTSSSAATYDLSVSTSGDANYSANSISGSFKISSGNIAPTLSVQSASSTYSDSDPISATADSQSDTVAIEANGVILASATGSVSYDAENLGAGSYSISANDLTNELNSATEILTIAKATPIISFPQTPTTYIYTGTPLVMTANIQTNNNQIPASDYLNSKYLTSFTTSNMVTEYGLGTYTMSANSVLAANYVLASGAITSVYAQATPSLTLVVPTSYTYDGTGGTVSYGITTYNNQLSATLTLNTVTTIATVKTKTNTYTTPAGNATYTLKLSTSGNANYIATSASQSFSISPPCTTNCGTTTTVSQSSSGGGGGGGGGGGTGGGTGGGGGGGGSEKPVVSTMGSNCYLISNIAALNLFNVSFNMLQINVTDNFITPNYTGATISPPGASYQYSLYPNATQNILGASGYTVKLVNISYLPILKSVDIAMCANATTVNLTTPTTPVTTPSNTPSSGNTVTSTTTTTQPTSSTTATTTVPGSVIANVTNSTNSTSSNGVQSATNYGAFSLSSIISSVSTPTGEGTIGALVLIILIIISYIIMKRRKPKPPMSEFKANTWESSPPPMTKEQLNQRLNLPPAPPPQPVQPPAPPEPEPPKPEPKPETPPPQPSSGEEPPKPDF